MRNNVWRDFLRVVNQLEERYREICTRKVASRISSELVRLAPKAQKNTLALTQRDLAQLTGTTLFTVNRVLSQWEQVGIVRTQRNAIVMCDVPALVKMSQMNEG